MQYQFTTYEKQIEHLKANPEDIYTHWMDAIGIFKFCGFSSHIINSEDERYIAKDYPNDAGCLTIIKGDPLCRRFPYVNGLPDASLRLEIKADDRIPSESGMITVDDLHIFREWQEKIDSMQTIN